MISVDRLRTSHATWLVADPATGELRHVADHLLRNYIPIRSYAPPSIYSDWTLLATTRPVMCPGEPVDAEILSYRRFPVASGFGLQHPTTGKFLSAGPAGDVSANRDQPGGWESFQFEPVARIERADAKFDVLNGIGHLDAETVTSFAGNQDASPNLLAALMRLLDPSQTRQVARGISHLPIYQQVFHAVRMHLSAHQGKFEWTTVDHLRDGIEGLGWKVGRHTYGAPEIIDGQYGALSIGNFCSIAGNVQIIVANHKITTSTTYPFESLHRFWPSAGSAEADHHGKGVVIGNNVWIGVGACILPGARIGDGAIIGARAVVGGEVAPFSVVVGNPARVVRTRFDQPTIDRYLRLRWWDWPDYIVDRFISLILSEDHQAFLNAAEAYAITSGQFGPIDVHPA